MSQQLTINGFAFAKDSGVLEGALRVSELPRLHDLLAGIAGEVAYKVEGSLGERGQPQLRLVVKGVLPLACQRCLGEIAFDVNVDSKLVLLPEGAELTQDELEDDSRDYLPVTGVVDVSALVEDEVLLALPVAPRHEQCGLPSAAEAGERIMPFAALSKLKGKLN